MEYNKNKINNRDQQEMAFIMYHDPDGVLAAIFASMPLKLKQHCIRVGSVAGIIAAHAPENAIAANMTRQEYVNAVRYGGFYHEIGSYLVHNQWVEYPAAGSKILETEISAEKVPEPIRRVILETVGYFRERYDGSGHPNHWSGQQIPFHAGICAIANTVDIIANGESHFQQRTMDEIIDYICKNEGTIFLPKAVVGFKEATQQIYTIYLSWDEMPPIWHYNDLKPLNRPINKIIG